MSDLRPLPFQTRIPLRWRDLDHQGHVYHGEMLTLLDEARTVWLSSAIGSVSPDRYVVARIEIDYLAEISIDGEWIDVTISVARIGRTSLTTSEEIRLANGTVAARSTVTAVMWDRERRASRPLTPDEVAACQEFLVGEVVEHA
jgi:acyl-CoA thioester hydrolase